jgi:hypothetical protein
MENPYFNVLNMPAKTHEIVINNIVRLNITFLKFKNDAKNDILVELAPRSDKLFLFLVS